METKFITLYGRPNAGKLTAGAAMAKRFAEQDGLDVVMVLANNYEPKTNIVAPRSGAASGKKSLGELVISPTLSEMEALQNLLPVPAAHSRAYFLGYKNGESPFTYTAPVMSQMKGLFQILSNIADIVVCVPSALFWGDALSEFMLSEADLVYHLHELSPQGLSFFGSVRSQMDAHLSDETCERVNVLCKIEKEDAGLVATYEAEIGEARFRLPYSEEIRRNYKDGNIGSDLKTSEGRAYTAAIGGMCDYALGDREYAAAIGGMCDFALDGRDTQAKGGE